VVTDEGLMRRALFHAARAAGATTPNPMVGAVVVSSEGVVVGQGHHHRAGEPHAEVFALDEAGDRARGGTLFVTLEPCCHHGRTPPCTGRVIASGIRRVVVAMEDPNPLVRGQGIADLRTAGLEVSVGLLGHEARRLNRAFLTVHAHGRPLVIVKAAISQDRKIAAGPGTCTRLTSAAADRRTQRLRAVVDAVGVGSGTVLADDPRLTARDSVRPAPLTRVVFDRRLRTPPHARLFSTLAEGPVIILTRSDARETMPGRVSALERAGAIVAGGGDDISSAIGRLLAWDVSSVLVEGGAAVHRSLFGADLVDIAHVIVTPVLLGQGGVPVFGGLPDPLACLSPGVTETLGRDVWMEFDVHGDR
jgi:diaminohydroxyphosphoribosylaminopyrimidine deaminase/5-amino-6-(5-phosphoribosylamino)uracil reductase